MGTKTYLRGFLYIEQRILRQQRSTFNKNVKLSAIVYNWLITSLTENGKNLEECNGEGLRKWEK